MSAAGGQGIDKSGFSFGIPGSLPGWQMIWVESMGHEDHESAGYLAYPFQRKSTHDGSTSAFSLQSTNQMSGFKVSCMPIYFLILEHQYGSSVPSSQNAGGKVIALPVVGGLHHDYHWAA